MAIPITETCKRCSAGIGKAKLYGLCTSCSGYFRRRRSEAKSRAQTLSVEEFIEQYPDRRKVANRPILSGEIVNPIAGFVVYSKQMKDLWERACAAARHDATVLITGQTGTGKELIAQSIHASSTRKDKQMVVIDCTTLPSDLMESELFGHERGAFTGAHDVKRGLFEQADGGTVFLDEIAELPVAFQAKLLRVLESRTIRRVGCAISRTLNIRIVAATNRDLKVMIKEGTFRQDLYYRLQTFPLIIPPLCERKDDIAVLADAFLHALNPHKTLSDSALAAMQRYAWPGNVRELRNAIEYANIVSGRSIEVEDLPSEIVHE